jgi:proteic killer suppression protein
LIKPCRIDLTKDVEDALIKVPLYIKEKLLIWVDSVLGINKIRKIPGYHDEPLKGKRKGERSIRLNKAYRK